MAWIEGEMGFDVLIRQKFHESYMKTEAKL
jgi:hypothetical protein